MSLLIARLTTCQVAGRRAPINLGSSIPLKKPDPIQAAPQAPVYSPPEPEDPIDFFPRHRPKTSVCCAIIGVVALFVTVGILALTYNQASAKTDARIAPSQVIRESGRIGDIAVEIIEFRSKADHGKQIIGLPNISLTQVISYQVCCSYEGNHAVQCQGLGSQVLSQGSDPSSSKLELILGDSRNLDSNCRIVLWLK